MLYNEFKYYARKILNEYLKVGYTIEILPYKGDPQIKIMNDKLKVILKLKSLDDILGDGNEEEK